MRRLALLGLAALAVGAMFAAALALTWCQGVPAGAQVAGRALALAGRAVVGQAMAGEALQFHTVPPESAQAFERTRQRRGIVVKGVPDLPPAPAVPPAPSAPAEDNTTVVGPIVVNPRSGDMMRIGQDIHVERDQTVTGDVVAMGGDIVVDGHVEGDVQAMGGDVHLNSTARVDGDVFCMGGQLHEQPGAQVGGQRVTALGPKDKRWERKALHLRDRAEDESLDVGRPVRKVVGSMLFALIITGLAWGFFKLGPGRSRAALAGFRSEPGQSFLVGLLVALVWAPGFIAVALLAAILCITLIGIPVAVVLLLAYPSLVALMWIWGFAVGAAAIGQRVSALRGVTAPTPAGAAALGALALGSALLLGTLLKHIPSFGLLEGLGTLIKVLTWLTIGVVSTLGAGALLRNELAQGPLRRWWTGRQNGAASPAYPAAGPGYPDAPLAAAPGAGIAPAPPAPPAPAPPTAYMPPPADPGPPPLPSDLPPPTS